MRKCRVADLTSVKVVARFFIAPMELLGKMPKNLKCHFLSYTGALRCADL